MKTPMVGAQESPHPLTPWAWGGARLTGSLERLMLLVGGSGFENH